MDSTVTNWIQIIRGEFEEIPDLRLTKQEVQRMWGLDGTTCDALLQKLIDTRFLKRTPNGAYARVDSGH